jgi:hypothetical protein
MSIVGTKFKEVRFLDPAGAICIAILILTSWASLPTNSSDATLDDIYLMLPQNHIRLLRLQNTVKTIDITHGSKSLQCELAVFSLDSVPSYVALSYCWGDLGTTYPLSCLGQELQIQENLHAVLTRLHEVGFRDWLWADAVCINQHSDVEKNHQIPLMRYVFSQAHMVLGWLGEAPEGLHDSWEVMQRLPAALAPLKGMIGPPLDLQCSSESIEKMWPILNDLLGCSFFKRLWIVQEVALARAVSLLCGDLLFSWMDLISITRGIVDSTLWMRDWLDLSLSIELGNVCTTIQYTHAARELLHEGRYIYNASALSSLAKMLEATDLRDKVYGILGLLPPAIQDKIEVDVGKSIIAVYADFTRGFLEYDNRLELLEEAGISNSCIEDLPSWCIDFSQGKKKVQITHPLVNFGAGKRKSLLPCIEYLDPGSSGPFLTLLGWKVDCITKVVKDMPYLYWNNWDMEMTEAIRKCDEDCLQISRTIFNTPDDIPDEHWRTITCDRGSREKGDEKGSRREEYLEWKQFIGAMAKCEPFPEKQGANSLMRPPKATRRAFNDDVAYTCFENTFYSTKGGRIGIGPPDTKPGDFVCIPYTSRVPFIMRKNYANGRYKLVGDTYCSGVMYGEIFDMGDELKAMEVRFVIE